MRKQTIGLIHIKHMHEFLHKLKRLNYISQLYKNEWFKEHKTQLDMESREKYETYEFGKKNMRLMNFSNCFKKRGSQRSCSILIDRNDLWKNWCGNLITLM